MAVTRRDIIEAVKATEPFGTSFDYTKAVLAKLDLKLPLNWVQVTDPVWGARWWDAEGEWGFVSKIIVNDPLTFLSTDNQGRDRRLPVVGKKFFVPPQPKGG